MMKSSNPDAIADADAIRRLIKACENDTFVRERIAENISGAGPGFDKEHFWWVLMGCLLTTQQRSTTGSPVDRFLSLKEFPLTLARCKGRVEQTVLKTLTDFGCSRWPAKIARQAVANHSWLEKDGWARMQRWFNRLAEQRALKPERKHARRERDAAHFAAINLDGIGPKQSRNLWQWLGLTRYEVPLDSRVVGWINRNLSIQVDAEKLSDDRYYERVVDYLQDACDRAGVLPCVFDAAAFDNTNTLAECRCDGEKSS